MNLIINLFLTTISALPIADNDLNRFDNYLPKFDEFEKYTRSNVLDESRETNEILSANRYDLKIPKNNYRTMGDVIDFMVEGAEAGLDLIKDVKQILITTISTRDTPAYESVTTTERFPENTTIDDSTIVPTEIPINFQQETTSRPAELTTLPTKLKIDPIFDRNLTDFNITSNRQPRQEEEKESDNGDSGDGDNNTVSNDENDSEFDQDDDDEEEDMNMITGLISTLLSGLSRPDGSIDVEAITGLLGSLSTQNDDGTYDFQGLTDLLMGFFGGDEDGGGSDFGAFLGGITGAFIKGVARPPGAKGSGIFTGNLLARLLPALSGPAPAADGDQKPPATPPTIDAGGFLSGFLSSFLGSSSGGGAVGGSPGGGTKFSILKTIISIFTSIFSSLSSFASSSSSSSGKN